MKKYIDVVLNREGQPISGVSVRVKLAGTSTSAVVYSDNGTSAKANPVVTDSEGSFSFYVADGRYDLTYSGSGFTTRTDSDVVIEDSIDKFIDLADDAGASLVGFIQSGTGAVATDVQSKLREFVSVKDFGAVGDGVTDDTAAIAAFFAYAQANKCHAVMEGDFSVSAPITSTGGAGSTFQFNATITASAAMDWVIEFVNHSGIYASGELEVFGAGASNNYADRVCKDGIVFEGCRGSKFEKLRAEKFLRHGVLVSSTGNNTLLDIGDVRTHYCGSAPAVNYAIERTYSDKSNTGTASSASQRSVFTLDAAPPANLAVGAFAYHGDEPYYITAISDNTITVYPWIKDASATGTIGFIIGGGVKIEGDDAANVNLNALDATYCGVGLQSSSLYGCNAHRLVSQLCAAALVVGNNLTSAYYGTTVESFYTEGNLFDIVQTTSGTVGLTINGMYEFTPEKFFKLSPRLASLEYDGLFTGAGTTLINTRGRPYAKLQGANGLGGYSSTHSVTADNSVIPIKGGNTISIALALDSGVERNFGHNHVTFIVYGRRTGSRVDSVTFTPANGAHTIMGAASYVISGVTTVMLVTAWFDYEASNWVISKQEMSTRLSGSATYDPASLADGAGATTSVTVAGAILGDYAVASFSRDLQGIAVTAWVSATDTVSVRFQNETGAPIDLLSGTLRALVAKQ